MRKLLSWHIFYHQLFICFISPSFGEKIAFKYGNVSKLSGTFTDGPETFQCNFKGCAQKLPRHAKSFQSAMPIRRRGFWAFTKIRMAMADRRMWYDIDRAIFINIFFLKTPKVHMVSCIVLFLPNILVHQISTELAALTKKLLISGCLDVDLGR